jgi:hypothetical protein
MRNGVERVEHVKRIIIMRVFSVLERSHIQKNSAVSDS